MGFVGKILLMAASALGVVYTVASIIGYRVIIEAEVKPDYANAAIACMFITFFIYAGALVFLFVTLCCPCSDVIMGIIIGCTGGAACLFSIFSYGSMNKQLIDLNTNLPTVGEWLFGSMAMGAGLLLVALTMAVS
ncbi:unnamed protein product [Dicrocoelium dendriticum]|nr:unnamed protein product [Dicrocoelium dendriticum]